MDDYVDRELAPDDVTRVRAHLETCAACAGEYAFEEDVLRTVRAKVRRVAIPADLRARIDRALRTPSSFR